MIVRMRTDNDCMAACLAMLMNWPYGKAVEYFPPIAIRKYGSQWNLLIPYLRKDGIYLICFDENIFSLINWNKPAMVDVPALTAPEKGDHIIFWNGEKVIDPSNKTIKYDKLPSTINLVYQINNFK